jgi:hypothetical protein
MVNVCDGVRPCYHARMRMESVSHEKEKSPEGNLLPISSPLVQGDLMYFSFHQEHPDVVHDIDEVMVADIWTKELDGSPSLADLYRIYVEDHPDEHILIKDPSTKPHEHVDERDRPALATLLQKIKGYKRSFTEH